MQLNYRVLEIKEVWHFENSSEDLFKEYVSTFLRTKQESSDYPEWVHNQSDKDKYISDYFEHEGVQLRSENIAKNPGLRQVAKLCLNSLWGKFGQQCHRVQSELIFEAKRFYELVNSDEHEIHDLHLINQEIVELLYKRKKECQREDYSTNIFIALFTTAHARLELFELIHKLGRRVLYFDTDSCIYLSRESDSFQPQLSDYLGGLTDEIDNDRHITEFVCCGPKNYGYRLSDGSCNVKIKGFRLNHKNSRLLNMESMKSLALNLEQEAVIRVVNERKISREPITRKVINRREEKKYRLVYDKRIILEEGRENHPFWVQLATKVIKIKSITKINSTRQRLFT